MSRRFYPEKLVFYPKIGMLICMKVWIRTNLLTMQTKTIYMLIIVVFLTVGTWIPHNASRQTATRQFMGCAGITVCYDADVQPQVWNLLQAESFNEIHYGASGENYPLLTSLWRSVFVKRSVIIDGPEFERGGEKLEDYTDYNADVIGNSYWHIQNYTFFNIPFGKTKRIRVSHA